MGESQQPEVGTIGWIDLSVDDAETIRDFYCEVVGWKPEPVAMNGYSDFNMTTPESGRAVVGICHARDTNAELPAQWLVYITVADVEQSARSCEARGGRVLHGPKSMGSHGRYCIIQDPAGAVAALFEPASS
jgi:predicted enzyme related to lactoylglutathione lyase